MPSIPSSFQSLSKIRARPYLLRLGVDVALLGQHEEHLLGEAGKGTGECFYLAFGPQLIHAPHRGDDALDGSSCFPSGSRRSEGIRRGLPS